MSAVDHWPVTPLPWTVGPYLDILDANGQKVARLASTRGKAEPEEVNAERIAACVNACAGIPLQVLQAQACGGLPWSVADQLDRLAERESVKTSLAMIALAAWDSTTADTAKVRDMAGIARAALARLGGRP